MFWGAVATPIRSPTLLQLLAIGAQQVAEGKVERYEDVAQELRTELKADRLGR